MALGVIAVVVSVVALLVSWLSYRESKRSAGAAEHAAGAADRSAAAAESADLRALTPRLTITLAGPADMSSLAIYRVRNDGPVDLDDVTVARPRPPDHIEYHLAVTGADFAEDEISLGPIALTQEAKLTLGCGVAESLPEFHVRIECRSGAGHWTLTEQLPSPRPPDLSDEEKAKRRQVLTFALAEIEGDIAVLGGSSWHTVQLRDANFVLAHGLVIEHAPDWIGPVRDARTGLDEFRAWNDRVGSAVESEAKQHCERLSSLLGGSHTTFQNLRAALETPQASGVRWRS